MHAVDKVLRIAACSLVLLGSATMRASAQSSSSPTATLSAEPEAGQPADLVGRGYFTLAMAGGEQRSVRVLVTNTGSVPTTIRAYPVDGVATSDGGVSYSSFDQPITSAGGWVSVDSPNLQLAPAESRRVTATITVPANATTGDHVAGIAVEEASARPGTSSSQVVIDVFYRRAIAIVVAVPGERTTALEVGGVALSQDARGNRAVVQIRNTGNSLVKAKGTLKIGGSQASGVAQTFSVDTLIPGTGAGIVVRVPSVKLAPGTYNAHVTLQAEDGRALADWDGSVAYMVPGRAEPTAAPAEDVSLAPVDAAPAAAAAATLSEQDAAAFARQAAATDSPGLWLLGILALVLILMRTGFVLPARRQPSSASSS